MRKFLLGMTVTFLVIFFVAAVVFAILFITKNNEVVTLQAGRQQAAEEISSLQGQVEDLTAVIEAGGGDAACPSSLSFVDEGMDVSIDYPCTWEGVLTVEMSDDFIYDEATGLYGPVASTYEYELTKGSSTLKFTKLLGGVGDVPQGLPDASYNYQELANDVVRYQEKGATGWSYAEKVNCSDVLPEELNGATMCIAHFFPGFGNPHFASQVRFTGDESNLTEADAIAVSAAD